MKKSDFTAQLQADLAAVFDDNLHTRKWHNIADYVIIGMILLSTAEIFISTFDLSPEWRTVMQVIDRVTLVFFTIEVSLRIWVAPALNPRYAGFLGRIRYCLSFNGLVDIIATYPYYIQWLIPMPIMWLKSLRITRLARMLRVSRYLKSWRLLTNAISQKSRELIISMQFLIIITFILSLVLFYSEHEAQPEVYDNGFASVLWAFAQYIGDPGQFADTPPITLVGRIVACIVGLLGIAIVAVPAGILGAGFTETIENETKQTEIKENASLLRDAFERKVDRPSGYIVVPPYLTIATLQVKLSMTMDDIVEAVNSKAAPLFRLVNVSSAIPAVKQANDTLAVEHFEINRPYGCLIDRGSPITICSPSSCIDVGIGNWAFYLALIGGFNFISREVGSKVLYRSYYLARKGLEIPGMDEFIADMKMLLSRKNAWSITTLVASGALEPELPTQVHFTVGGPKGDPTMGGEGYFVKDVETYTAFYNDVSSMLFERFGMTTDHQKYHAAINPNHLYRREKFENGNNIVMRVEWEKILFNPNRFLIVKTIAEAISRHFAGKEIEEDAMLKRRGVGFDGYFDKV